MPQPILLSKSQYVSVAHRYWDMRYSPEENHRHYGTQASVAGLGSNMRLELGLMGGSEAGLNAPLALAKKLLDHRRLFTEFEEFKTKASTLERIALFVRENVPNVDTYRVEENQHLICHLEAGAGELELEMKVLNLSLTFRGTMLENGMLMDRRQVTQAVMDEYKANQGGEGQEPRQWAEQLYTQLCKRVPVQQLRIDLGRQRYILVKSEG